MRTTLDLPDETFRQLKARAALSGLKLKDLVTQFIERGLAESQARAASGGTTAPDDAAPASTRFDHAPWVEMARHYVKPGMSHDMDEIRTAIAQGWETEVAPKCEVADANECPGLGRHRPGYLDRFAAADAGTAPAL